MFSDVTLFEIGHDFGSSKAIWDHELEFVGNIICSLLTYRHPGVAENKAGRSHSLLPGRNDPLDVSRAVQNPNYLNALGYLAVEYDVIPNWKAV